MPSDLNNETPRKNNINPQLNPDPSSGDNFFPNKPSSSNNQFKPPVLDGILKSIKDNKKEKTPLIRGFQLPNIHQL